MNEHLITSRTVNRTLRVMLNEYASNFESLNGDKHHVPDAFFRIIFSIPFLFFSNICLAVEIKQEYKDCQEKLFRGKASNFVREI